MIRAAAVLRWLRFRSRVATVTAGALLLAALVAVLRRASILEILAGLTLVITGVAQIHPPSAYIVAGLGLCGISYWTEARR